jgi:hypothetical protein
VKYSLILRVEIPRVENPITEGLEAYFNFYFFFMGEIPSRVENPN